MGIERFFNSIIQTKVLIAHNVIVGFVDKINTDYFYIDFNSILHNVVIDIEHELNYLLYSIILLHDCNEIKDNMKSISEKWNFNFEVTTIESYIQHFSSEVVDDMIIKRTFNKLIELCTNFIDPINLKLLYIAIDGVPQLGKIIEQKKRRYNAYIISKLKKKIFEEFKHTLPEKRKIYDETKIMYDKTKIVSWGTLMERMQLIITSPEFKNTMKENCLHLESIIVSDQNIYGEGEKKIMENMIKEHLPGNYTIYSPDADMIILGIIETNIIDNSHIKILRFNAQEANYDIIDIDKLCSGIYEYIQNKVSNTVPNILLDKKNVTNDISFIFTLFGNDFLPKMESIDVRNDFETLLECYCDFILNKTKFKYLIFKENDNKGFRINYDNFKLMFNIIAHVENDMLNETYMASQYKNYHYLKSIFGKSKLLNELTEYIKKANEIFGIWNTCNNTCNDTCNNTLMFKNKYVNDVEFMRAFLLLEFIDDTTFIKNILSYKTKGNGTRNSQIIKVLIRSNSHEINEIIENMSLMELDRLFNDMPNEIKKISRLLFPDGIEEIIKTFEIDKIISLFFTSIKRIFNGTVEIKYGAVLVEHTDPDFSKKDNKRIIRILDQIKENMHHPEMEITDYDINVWQLEKKIGKYRDKLNSHNFDLGKIEIVVKNRHYNMYKLSTIESAPRYYKTFFELDSDIIVNKTGKQIVKIKNIDMLVDNYISGLFWVFDNYFNKNITEYNQNIVSKFTYSYHRAPLLFQINGNIYKYSNDDFHKIYSLARKSNVPVGEFMNKLEHYLYITPKHNYHHNIPDVYKAFTVEHIKLFPDLNNMAEQLWSGSSNDKIIDCQRIQHLNKCNLIGLPFVTFDEYMEKIKELRNQDEFNKQI